MQEHRGDGGKREDISLLFCLVRVDEGFFGFKMRTMRKMLLVQPEMSMTTLADFSDTICLVLDQ